MRLDIVGHQEEPRAHRISIRSDNGSEDFTPVPNTVSMHIKVHAALLDNQ